jgi:hypothetical protein
MPIQPREASEKSGLINRPEGALTHETARETGSAIIGALVGVALGGVPGALIGATVPPILSGVIKISTRALQRRHERAERILNQALESAKLCPEDGLKALDSDDEKIDQFISLLSQAASADPSVEIIFSSVLGEMLVSRPGILRERLLIIADALRGIRSVHMRILISLHANGDELSARDLAAAVQIPEIELRSVVRDLELRGIIKDMGVHPIKWQLRTLGRSIVEYSDTRKEKKTP